MQNEITNSGFNMQDLITKFYYNDNHLCFQILVKESDGDSNPYMEFTSYSEYRKVFNELTEMKGRGERIKVRTTNGDLTNMSFM